MGDVSEKCFWELFFSGFLVRFDGSGGTGFRWFSMVSGVGERPNEWGRVGRSVGQVVGPSPPPSPQKKCGVILHLVCGSLV